MTRHFIKLPQTICHLTCFYLHNAALNCEVNEELVWLCVLRGGRQPRHKVRDPRWESSYSIGDEKGPSVFLTRNRERKSRE